MTYAPFVNFETLPLIVGAFEIAKRLIAPVLELAMRFPPARFTFVAISPLMLAFVPKMLVAITFAAFVILSPFPSSGVAGLSARISIAIRVQHGSVIS